MEQAEKAIEKIIKYLNLLKLLLNSKVFLLEMTEQNELLLDLAELIQSQSPFISLLAC